MLKYRAGFLIVIGLAVVATACSDDPLADIGQVTNAWIGEDTTPDANASAITTPEPILRTASQVIWANDHLLFDPVAPEDALASVWSRREPGNKYVQATRTEIAGVLPGVRFPSLLPEDIEFVSSQLLFDGDGSLANDFIAAFGLWTAEPYTLSRSVGQYGILWITHPDADLSGCDRFANRDISSCDTVLFSGSTAWQIASGGEETLVWIDGEYQYELYHRAQLDAETALEMAGAMMLLSDFADSPSVDAPNEDPVATDE